MRRVSLERQAQALKAKRRLAKRLQGHPDIVGLGIGFRERRGRIVQTLCIRIYVARKFPDDLIPANFRLPRIAGGFPVDVVVARYRSHAGPSSRHNPLLSGITIANERRFEQERSIGTLGCIVRVGSRRFALSNWHVLYGVNGADGESVVQPRPLGPEMVIGATAVGIISQQVDCALVSLDGTRSVSLNVLGLSGSLRPPVWPQVGDVVRKSGANGVGVGFISAVGLSTPVDIEGVSRVFDDQIEIRPRADLGDFNTDIGDSGATWFRNSGGHVVALHLGGDGTRAIATPMATVFQTLRNSGYHVRL